MFLRFEVGFVKNKKTFSTPSADSVGHLPVVACAGFPILLVSCNLMNQTGYPCFYFRNVDCSRAETGVVIIC